ncbi:hypothetical protein KV097_15750 [Mumia sp. zg.B17]|uniref:hypothetical protein n=1 Tax=Mumia sp. zg.B17 TaxID=2855446 RepID=UPI001C6E6E20|nr:hypothetical protein [Mumia sp. zg.B17]MBW9207396.1 hypothetical protein [Mumia sp. zg.B17]
MVDLRDPVDIEALLDEVGADDLPLSTRSGLVDEGEQASAGLDRFWKTDDPMWIRTQLVGGTEEPSSVMVEIAGSIGVTQWPDYTGWSLLRIDVVRADDQWEVSGFSAGGRRARPDDADPQLRDQLEGKGWRRVI